MVRHEAQRKHQNFSHPKYYPTLALHSQFYYIHLRGGKFAFESIDYDHIPIATPSQNTANTGPPRMVSEWTNG